MSYFIPFFDDDDEFEDDDVFSDDSSDSSEEASSADEDSSFDFGANVTPNEKEKDPKGPKKEKPASPSRKPRAKKKRKVGRMKKRKVSKKPPTTEAEKIATHRANLPIITTDEMMEELNARYGSHSDFAEFAEGEFKEIKFTPAEQLDFAYDRKEKAEDQYIKSLGKGSPSAEGHKRKLDALESKIEKLKQDKIEYDRIEKENQEIQKQAYEESEGKFVSPIKQSNSSGPDLSSRDYEALGIPNAVPTNRESDEDDLLNRIIEESPYSADEIASAQTEFDESLFLPESEDAEEAAPLSKADQRKAEAKVRREKRHQIQKAANSYRVQKSIGTKKDAFGRQERGIRRQRELDDIQDKLETAERATSSDRIIRRLSSFGIAHSAGISGQLFASLIELAVFQPEEHQYQTQQAAIKDQMRQEREQRRIEEAQQKFRIDQAAFRSDEEIKDVITEANYLMSQGEDVDADEVQKEIENIQNNLQKELNSISSGGNVRNNEVEEGPLPETNKTALDQSSIGSQNAPPMSSSPKSNVEPQKRAKSSLDFNIGTNTASPRPNHSRPLPENIGGSPKNKLKENIDSFSSGLQTSTKVLHAANITFEAIKLTSKALTDSLGNLAVSLADPDNSAKNVNNLLGIGSTAISGVVSSAGTVAGASVGVAVTSASAVTSATVGTAIGGPMGTVAGGVLGATIGTAAGKVISSAILDPIVSLSNMMTGIYENVISESIGSETISASVHRDLTLMADSLERSLYFDRDTAEYIRLQTNLTMALRDMQEQFLIVFGDDLKAIIRILTKIVTDAGQVMILLKPLAEVPMLIASGHSFMEAVTVAATNAQEALNRIASSLDPTEGLGDQVLADINQFFGNVEPGSPLHRGMNPGATGVAAPRYGL